MNKIVLWINVIVDDWTAELEIIAINDKNAELLREPDFLKTAFNERDICLYMLLRILPSHNTRSQDQAPCHKFTCYWSGVD